MNFADYDKPRPDKITKLKRKRILIVTEGLVTEKLYFEELKVRWDLRKSQIRVLEVEVECGPEHDGNTPSRVVSSAIKLRDEELAKQKDDDLEASGGYDEVWVVFDTERKGKRNDLEPAAEFAAEQDLCIAISRPSFESWFLLHLRDGLPTGMITCDDVCTEISKITKKKPLNHSYSKTSKDNADLKWLIKTIVPSTDHAMKRSAQTATIAFTKHPHVPEHPGTHVHKLVKVLWESSPKGTTSNQPQDS